MKTLKKLTGLLLAIALMGSTVTFASDELVGSSAASQKDTYTLEEMLEYALQDERIAQAEYDAIMKAFDVTRPFSNIKEAEITHENAVISLYEARDMLVPDFDGTEYVVLPDTLDEIYAIGVEAEINNIAMYDAFLSQELDADVHAVFTALRDGSVNHLTAFERAGQGNSAAPGQNTSGGGQNRSGSGLKQKALGNQNGRKGQ